MLCRGEKLKRIYGKVETIKRKEGSRAWVCDFDELGQECRMFMFWWQWLVLNRMCSKTASKYLLYFYCSGLEDHD